MDSLGVPLIDHDSDMEDRLAEGFSYSPVIRNKSSAMSIYLYLYLFLHTVSRYRKE